MKKCFLLISTIFCDVHANEQSFSATHSNCLQREKSLDSLCHQPRAGLCQDFLLPQIFPLSRNYSKSFSLATQSAFYMMNITRTMIIHGFEVTNKKATLPELFVNRQARSEKKLSYLSNLEIIHGLLQ